MLLQLFLSLAELRLQREAGNVRELGNNEFHLAYQVGKRSIKLNFRTGNYTLQCVSISGLLDG